MSTQDIIGPYKDYGSTQEITGEIEIFRAHRKLGSTMFIMGETQEIWNTQEIMGPQRILLENTGDYGEHK